MLRSALAAFLVLSLASLALVSFITKHSGAWSTAAFMPAPRGAAAAEPAPARSVGSAAVIQADPLGHFAADVDIDGHRIRMLVDTGASFVALTSEDAAMLGLQRADSDFRVAVTTANGIGRAAPARLWRVRIGNVEIYDVAALVFPPNVLKQSLLGMSALNKLRNFEISAGRLVLQQ